MEENNAGSSSQHHALEKGLSIYVFQNNTSENQTFKEENHRDFIQFHFCVKGKLMFVFNNGNYTLPLEDEKGLLLYNPEKDLPLHVILSPNSWLVTVLISIQKLHSQFSDEANYIDFLTEENRSKKYYQEFDVFPAMAVNINQILNFNLHPSVKKIYLKGKIYELLGLCFNRNEEADIEQCPFLIDETNVQRIRKAKEIIIQRMVEPPTLHELSEEIGLSLKKLKEGFKEIYGDTVYGFLLDYKMDYARQLLETKKHNVNEVGHKIGYSTSSHFIAAFKKEIWDYPQEIYTIILTFLIL